ncbi:MAG: tetratricopeptide repeat protein [Lyngbya sp.]|nr:tetratricopeptide repeat protein [Lyngbya sp.]
MRIKSTLRWIGIVSIGLGFCIQTAVQATGAFKRREISNSQLNFAQGLINIPRSLPSPPEVPQIPQIPQPPPPPSLPSPPQPQFPPAPQPKPDTVPELPLTNFDYDNVEFWEELCSTLEQTERYAEAVAACQRVIELKPKRENTEIWMSLSRSLQQLKQYPQALVSYNYVLQREPKYSQVLLQKCEIFLELEQYEQAISSCEEALKIDGIWGRSSPADAWTKRAIALLELGRLETAKLQDLGQVDAAESRKIQNLEAVMNSYDQALRFAPNSSLILTEKCGILIELERYQEARESCELAIAVNENWGVSTSAQALEYLLVIRQEIAPSNPLRVNNPKEAEELAEQFQNLVSFYEQILSENPNNAEAWTKQGIALQTLGKTAQALTSYSRAVQIQPNYSLALANQCEVLNQLEQYQQALSACEAALSGDQNWGDTRPAKAWNQRSTALAGLKQYNDALASADRAITLEEDYSAAWNNRGVMLWHLGQLQQAEQQYEFAEINYEQALLSTREAVKLDPRYPQGWYNHGRILSEYGQLLSLQRRDEEATELYQAARKAYEQALAGDLTPNDRILKASILANQAVVLWRLRDSQLLTEALVATQEAVQLNPQSFEAWHNQGLILLELKQYRGALNAYTQADTLSPDNVGVITAKGIALSRLGRYQDALAIFEQALQLDPEYMIARREREIVLRNLIKMTQRMPR